MSRPVIVLGGGGHARVLIDALLLRSIRILGITEVDAGMQGQTVLGMPVIGTDDAVLEHAPATVLLVNGLGSVAIPERRRRLFEGFKAKGYDFASVIHPSAVVAADVVVGEGGQIMAGAVLQTGTRLGVNVIVNTRVSIDHDCTIGDHAHLAPGVTLSGGVSVGAGVHIGSGATIIQGVQIGHDTLIGAGSLVLKDLSARVTAFGSPAKVVQQ